MSSHRLMDKIQTSVPNPAVSPQNELIRVFLFEATQMSGELLSHALEKSKYGLTVVGYGVSLGSKDEVQLAQYDVIVISSALKDGPLSGFALLKHLAKANPSARCVMLLDQGERDLVVEAFRNGAAGVCERDQPYEMLCKCIYSVSRGQVWANSQQLKYVMEALATGMSGRVTDARGQLLLTRREDEICSLVAEGLKNREIAQLLSLSEHTVKNHLFRIFERLGISSRTELILYVLGQRNALTQRER
jgi:DNA-binding NarL/FixJ family response regulator